MSPDAKPTEEELAGNPCPFLRGLVETGAIQHDPESIRVVGTTCAAAFPAPARSRRRAAVISLIALVGNGLSPFQLSRNARSGLTHSALRNGPLDKRGVGTRVLDEHGRPNSDELDRLDGFATDYRSENGTSERGLGGSELTTMMDANFARAEASRRRIDRRLMDGEWPVLLDVMGKHGPDGRYLAIDEVRTLVVERHLPDRVIERLRPL